MPIQSGSLGGGSLQANTEVMGYNCQAPAVAATVTVSFCNKTQGPILVRLAIGSGADSSAAGTVFLEYDAKVEPSGTLERSGIALSAGRKIFVRSNLANIDYAIYGYEK